MKTLSPENNSRMKVQAKRFKELAPILGVPEVLALQCEITLKVFYGSRFRAGMALLWHGLVVWSRSKYWRVVYRFCDLVGWTHLRAFSPDEPKILMRHGRQCTYLNCSDMGCVEKAIPQWYQKLTRMHAED